MHQLKRSRNVVIIPTQLGVGVNGGYEIIVHSVRSLIDIYSSSTDKCLLKIDFKNAFNLMRYAYLANLSLAKLLNIFQAFYIGHYLLFSQNLNYS